MAVKNGAYSLEEKQEALAYFNKNEVPKQIEQLLNKMFKEKPSDIFGYMAEYFGKRSQTPTILKSFKDALVVYYSIVGFFVQVSTGSVLSSCGYSTFDLNVHCLINGLSKYVATVVAPVDSRPLPDIARLRVKTPDLKSKTPEHAKQQKVSDVTASISVASVDNAPKGLDINEVMQRVECTIAPLIAGSNPVDQNAVDAILHALEKQERTVSTKDSPPGERQTETAPGGQETFDVSPEDSKTELVKKTSLSKAESKQLQTQQDAAKNADRKKQSVVPNKDVVGPGASDLEKEEVFTDYAMIAVSMGTALAATKIKDCSLYEHLAQISGKKLAERFTLPIPMMTLLTSGKCASGKQNLIKEIMLLPLPGTSIKEGLQQLTGIYLQMGNILAQKFGASGRCVTDDGSYSPALDKPEQALDYVQDAVSACGYSLGADINIALNCAASDFYDQEKQKYEIMTNTFKSLDDVISLYCELHERYSGIVVLVDGLRSPDREGWIKLNQRIGEKCFVVGGDLYKKHSSILESGVADKLSSGAVLGLDQANTITILSHKAKAIADQGGVLLMDDGPCSDTSSIVVDVAVAFGSRFIRLGGPVRGEHVCKYRRLQEIEQELEEKGYLDYQEQHAFPVINVTEQEDGENEHK